MYPDTSQGYDSGYIFKPVRTICLLYARFLDHGIWSKPRASGMFIDVEPKDVSQGEAEYGDKSRANNGMLG
jgi:hypothetical protein